MLHTVDCLLCCQPSAAAWEYRCTEATAAKLLLPATQHELHGSCTSTDFLRGMNVTCCHRRPSGSHLVPVCVCEGRCQMLDRHTVQHAAAGSVFIGVGWQRVICVTAPVV